MSTESPRGGEAMGSIPRGIEVLVSKASLDAEFRALLLKRRAKAADEIGLALSPAESMMLGAIPAAQLEAVIARTKVAPSNRRAFLGRAAAVMLAALGMTGCEVGCVKGIRPDRARDMEPGPTAEKTEEPPEPAPRTTTGIRADRPPVSEGIRPDRPPPPTGSRPDRP
jgi:hypothetical protein